MLNKKRAFISLGAAILIFVIASFVILLIWKILKSPEWMSTLMVWIIAWPILLLAKVISIPYPGRAGLVFAISITITIDVAVLSGLVYAALSLLNGKPQRVSPPPPPFPFQ